MFELKNGWQVRTEGVILGWFDIQTEYWRGNRDAINFTYNEKEGIASDDSETEFEVGTCHDPNWFIDPRVNRILKNALIIIKRDEDDSITLEKKIKSIDDLYVFGKALYKIDQLF